MAGKIVHRMSNSSTYHIWSSMLQRCTNPKARSYEIYGGRGIAVCDKWKSFVGFLEDMGERPHGKSLDRIDGEKGYCKDNCRWASDIEQARNKCNNVRHEFRGTPMLIPEIYALLAEEGVMPKVSQNAASTRLSRGWGIEDALFLELGSYKPNHKNNKFTYYDFFGSILTIRDAMKKHHDIVPFGQTENGIYRRIKRGWKPTYALIVAPHKGRKDDFK